MTEKNDSKDARLGCGLIVLIIICVIVYFVNGTKSIDEIAEQVSEQLPVNCVGVGKIDAVETNGNGLIFVIDASGRFLDYSVTSDMDIKDMVGDNILILLSSLEILDDVIDSGTNVIFQFRWSDYITLDYAFSNKEIKSRREMLKAKFEYIRKINSID